MNSNMNLNINLNHPSHINNLNNILNLPTNSNNQNQNDKKKEEINFEKLLIGILEFKQEAFKSLKVYSDFFKNYLNQNDSCNNTKEILGFICKLEENKKIINENIQIQKNFISAKNKDRSAKLDKISDFIQNYLHISNVLNKNKRKYKENVLMSNSESASLNFHLVQTLNKSNLLKEQMIKLDDSILKTKALSKNLVSQEYELMNKILTSGRELSELNMETGKNKTELNILKSSYAKLVEKSEYFKNIKSNICAANQRNKTFLMRKLFQIRKMNENLHISSQIKVLSSNSAENIQEFSAEESLIFSEILENSKSFHKKLTEILKAMEIENKELISSLLFQEENLKKRLCFLFSFISSNYNDIVIDNFTEFNYNTLSFVEGGIKIVNDQIMNKFNKCANDLISSNEEYESVKNRVRNLNEKIIEAVTEKKNKNSIKKSFILLKNVFKTMKAKKEQALEREKTTTTSNLPPNYSKDSDENFKNHQKTKKNKKEGKEKKPQIKEDKKADKISQKKILMSNSKKNLSSCNKEDIALKLKDNCSNKRPNNNIYGFKCINEISDDSIINKRFALKCDIPTIEKSIVKEPETEVNLSTLIKTVSNNIDEVSQFHQNPTFGDKKNRRLNNIRLI